jgi:inorganic triphosphatase YgiF
MDIHEAGIVLRVRSDGDRFVMTAKSRNPGNGKALERTEWKHPVRSMKPDLAAFCGFLPAEIAGRIKNKPLVAVFSTEVRRRTRILATPQGIVELAIDRGRIVAGDRMEDISEVELELMEGRTEALFLLARDLVSEFQLRPSIRSKSDRGFDLAAGNPPAVSKAQEMTAGTGATLDQAVDGLLRSALQHLLDNQPAAEDGRDPAGIHQYRVALRRLRSILGVIRPLLSSSQQLEQFQTEARWLMSSLNDARDWDVFVTGTLPSIAQACPSVDGFEALTAAAQKRRDKAHEKARAAIGDRRTGQFQITLGLWVEQKRWRGDASPEGLDLLSGPARSFAADVLDRLRHKVLKRGRHFERLTPEERHRLRIAIKKLRYATGFFLPLLGNSRRHRSYAKLLATLQEQLGHRNDMAVIERLVRPLTREKIPVSAQRAAGALLGWQAAHLGLDDADLAANWKKMLKADIS